jgi:hypothetical protein
MATKTLPAGIFWERTGGRTHRVTIRREPEVMFDWDALRSYSAQSLGFQQGTGAANIAYQNQNQQLYANVASGPYVGGGMLSGVFGGLF